MLSEVEAPKPTGPSTKKTYKYSEEQRNFVVACHVKFGESGKITKLFEQKYGQTISASMVSYLKHAPKYQALREKVAKEYERLLSSEFLASKRNRVNALTKIYELGLKSKDYKLAKDCVSAIDLMIEGKKGGDFHVLNLTQNNTYAVWDLNEIGKEKARLLGRLEHAMIESEEINEESS